MTPDRRYAQIVRAFLRRPGITQQGRGFGSAALRIRGKMFATLSPAGAFVVKLPRQRGRHAGRRRPGQAVRTRPRPGDDRMAGTTRGIRPGLDVAGRGSPGVRRRRTEMSRYGRPGSPARIRLRARTSASAGVCQPGRAGRQECTRCRLGSVGLRSMPARWRTGSARRRCRRQAARVASTTPQAAPGRPASRWPAVTGARPGTP
jgi:hypothetical protein